MNHAISRKSSCFVRAIAILLLMSSSAWVNAQTYSSTPAANVDVSTGTAYQMRLVNIVGATASFRVTSTSGNNFSQPGRIDVRQSGHGEGNPIVGSATYAANSKGSDQANGVEVTVSLAGFTSGTRSYYVTRWATVESAFDGAQWAGPISITATPGTHLPNPIVSVNPLTSTTARATWTWSGNTANATEIRIALVKTNGFNGPTIETLIADQPISKTSTSIQLDSYATLLPGSNYRVNVRYVAAPGYTDGSTAMAFTTTAHITLPVPNVRISPITQTTARATWTWSGNTSNATEIRIALVRTDGFNGPTLETLIADQPISKTATSIQLDNDAVLTPGTNYRVNVRYVAASGYTDGSAAKAFATTALTPLPAPNVSVSPLTSTTARATWTWSGNTANATEIRIALVKTNGFNGPTIETLVADQPISKTSTSIQLDSYATLLPGSNYRVNVRYVAGLGYSDGSTALAFATTPAPEIAIEQPAGTRISDGGSKHFSSVAVGKSGTAKIFTIKNSGTANLTGLKITKTGTNATNFTTTALVKTTLAPGSSTTFKVSFKPTAKGKRVAAIHIASNDANENPYDITLTGWGLAASPAIASAFDNLVGLTTGDQDRDTWKTLTTTDPATGLKYRTLLVTKTSGTARQRRIVEVSPNLIDWYSGMNYTTTLRNDASILKVRDNTPVTPEVKRYIRLKTPQE